MRDPATQSRSWFGRCGQELEDANATKYVTRYFYCTHGGLGGTPWTDVAPTERVDERLFPRVGRALGVELSGGVTNVTGVQDKLGSQQVWRWAMVEVAIALGQVELSRAIAS